MQKKTWAVTILTILYLIFIVAIGATLSTFKVAKERVMVEKITITPQHGISITNKDGQAITNLEVKSSSVGVRPATGEENTLTSIPTTVNDAVGTEGAYASFFLTSETNWEIKLVSCFLTAGMEDNLDNVRVAIMEEKNEPIKGSNVGAVLARGEKVNNKEYVVVAWLDTTTTKSIKGAKIFIELEVVIK